MNPQKIQGPGTAIKVLGIVLSAKTDLISDTVTEGQDARLSSP